MWNKPDIHFIFEEEMQADEYVYKLLKLTSRFVSRLKRNYSVDYFTEVNYESGPEIVEDNPDAFFDPEQTMAYMKEFERLYEENYLEYMKNSLWIEPYHQGYWGITQQQVEKIAYDTLKAVRNIGVRKKGRLYYSRLYDEYYGDTIIIHWFGRDVTGYDYLWAFCDKKSYRPIRENRLRQIRKSEEKERIFSETLAQIREENKDWQLDSCLDPKVHRYFNSSEELCDYLDKNSFEEKRINALCNIYFLMRIDGRIEPVILDDIDFLDNEPEVYDYAFRRITVRIEIFTENKYEEEKGCDRNGRTVSDMLIERRLARSQRGLHLRLDKCVPREPTLPEKCELIAVLDEREATDWLLKAAVLYKDYSEEWYSDNLTSDDYIFVGE